MRIQTKITIAAAAIAVGSALAFSATLLKYFSPNNDGTRDELEVPFSATDDGRIVSWKMVIENSRGKVVRTIGNKVTLPTELNAKSILKGLGKAKESVIIPESVKWDGTMDDGTMAPDGEYFYYISVTDADGNQSTTKKYNVFLDNTKPDANVTQLEGEDLVFGEGAKAVLNIKQTGSKEKKWTAKITDRDGNVVRTLNWDNDKPQNFTWDGTDDKGMIVPDGIYNYTLIGEDKAGNISDDAGIKNIIFSAEKPATNIFIEGTKYFSVAEKSNQTKIVLIVDIPDPKNGSANKLVDWSVLILNSAGNVVRTYNPLTTKSNVPLTRIEFDGKDDKGALVSEGEYFARVTAKYLNGYETAPVNTSLFTFDTTAPYGSVTATSKIFSPDGDGRMDFISFKISADRKGGSPISKWTGKIVNVKIPDVSVKEYDFGAFAPGEITWNGLDKNGKLAQDGEYDFELFGIDMAGNSVVAKTSPITLDTSKTEVMLAATDLVFSPNADGIKDSVTFTPVIKAGTNVAKYSFEIKNASGKTVYTQSGAGNVPQNFVWNGTDNSKKTLADGTYTACLTIDSSNGAQAKVEVPGVVIDTVAPSVETTASYLVFSPDGDGNKDSFVLNTKNCSQEKMWTVAVTDKSGKVVREFKFNKTISDSVNSVLKWDGIGENGNLVPDGKYSLVISSTDEAGNKFTKKIDGITLDTRAVKAYVTAAYEGISSKSNTGLTKQKFNLRTSVNDGIKNWKFEVVSEKGTSVYSVDSKNQSANASGVLVSFPKEIIWDGKTSDDKDAEGIFYGRLTMEYEKGNKVLEKSSSFICTQKAPELSVKTNPEFFSPDDDGTDDELNILLGAKCQGKLVNWSFVILNPDESGKKGKPFWKTNGTNKITEKLIWNGLSNVSKEKNGQAESVQSAMDYPWEFTVTDSIGLTTTIRGKISIDILVRRDGNVLKMAVPAIIFRANHADFKTAAEAPGSKVTPEQARNNERVLKRVAEVLKKFPDYTITVVGHANNTTGTEAEETSTANGNIPLIPLSQARAAFVKSKLEEYGVEGSRMKTEGKGGRERIAALKDTENWWKNRRVEFLLHK